MLDLQTPSRRARSTSIPGFTAGAGVVVPAIPGKEAADYMECVAECRGGGGSASSCRAAYLSPGARAGPRDGTRHQRRAGPVLHGDSRGLPDRLGGHRGPVRHDQLLGQRDHVHHHSAMQPVVRSAAQATRMPQFTAARSLLHPAVAGPGAADHMECIRECRGEGRVRRRLPAGLPGRGVDSGPGPEPAAPAR